MLLNLIILIALIWAFMIGYSRGLILQAIYSFGTILSAIVAANNYKGLAKQISMWIPFSSATENSHLLLFSNDLLFHLDEAFYAGVAFLMIFVVVYVIIRLIGLFLRFTMKPLGKNGKIIAGVLGLAATYFGLQMLLITLSLVPLATVQSHIDASFLARFMVLHTPITSGLLQNLFIENIVHINPLS
ncbi:CvpA family protein [Lactococcus allomyrinae]|uniref:CvpA family protein n=1 Tax=Lactococcus allomyrinae TaxID=2419773 RepID=A0A387BH46_9LACT|nr:CvpA family protein [Lactococcus allomyrinae]AYG00699.1 CvpA family protein [Lactococcus allomyrinae]